MMIIQLATEPRPASLRFENARRHLTVLYEGAFHLDHQSLVDRVCKADDDMVRVWPGFSGSSGGWGVTL